MRTVLVQGHSYRMRVEQMWRVLRKTNPFCRRGGTRFAEEEA
jgi:hypothetical protein